MITVWNPDDFGDQHRVVADFRGRTRWKWKGLDQDPDWNTATEKIQERIKKMECEWQTIDKLKHERWCFTEKATLEISRVKSEIAVLEKYLMAKGCEIPKEASETTSEDLFDYKTINTMMYVSMATQYVDISSIVEDLFDEEIERIINSFLYDLHRRSKEEIDLRVEIYKRKMEFSSKLSDLTLRLKQLTHLKNSLINSVELKKNLVKLQELDELQKEKDESEANADWWGAVLSMKQMHEAFTSIY